jgi:hypothetical protein
MPCTAARARMLLKRGKAIAKWNKLGIFHLQLKCAVEPKNQLLAIGIDPGSKYEAESMVGTRDTVLNMRASLLLNRFLRVNFRLSREHRDASGFFRPI